MSPTEIWLIVLTVIFGTATIFGAVAMFSVGYFKEHKSVTEIAVLTLFVLAATCASCAAAVHYGYKSGKVAACAVLGASGGLAVIAVLMIIGVTSLTRQVKMSVLTGTVVSIVLLLQIAVNVANPTDFGSGERLSDGVVFARIISGTFQYFSLDAEYTDIIQIGAATLPLGARYVFYILSCAMTVVAPIVGGFAIFGALGHFFPRLSLWMNIRPTKYVFSELNEYSIETAESIVELKNKLASNKAERERYKDRYGKAMYSEIMRSVIIFTDVYTDRKEEESSELLQRANKINAICIKDDILTRKIYWIAGRLYRLLTHSQKKVIYFLMDKADFYVEQGEENNLRTAVELFTTDRKRMVWEKTSRIDLGTKAQAVEIYVFSRNENADAIIKKAHERWAKQYDGHQFVAYKTINEYQSLVYGLIDGAFPLYTALEQPYKSGKYNTEKLSVLILGGGRIAKTFLKTVYYCGQMLCGKEPTKLKITTVSMDAKVTEKRLRFDMPEVFDPSITDYAAHKESFCEFKFIPAKYGTEKFADIFQKIATGDSGEGSRGIDVDYILVALGADNLNVQAADYIKQVLGKLGIPGKKVVPINYVIENSALSSAIGVRSDVDSNSVCVLNPFGSLKERFSFDNICMTEFERRALLADKAYSGDRGKRSLSQDAYSRNSSIATAIHTPYKMVCMSVHDSDFANRAYWLEHRRWTAYMRSTGNRNYSVAEFATMLAHKVDKGYTKIIHKNTDIKLHACITDCSDRLTETNELQRYLEDNPNFFNIMYDAFNAVKAGENLKLSSGEVVEKMDGFYEYMREQTGSEHDNLDMLSLMASGVLEDANKGRKFMASNFKTFDIDITKRLYFDLMCDRIVEHFFGMCAVNLCYPIDQIAALYKNQFSAQTKYARCDNNPAVLCCHGTLFAFVGRHYGYDMIMWQTTDNYAKESEERLLSKKSLVIKPKFVDYAIALVPQRSVVELKGANKEMFYAGVLKNGEFQVSLNINDFD